LLETLYAAFDAIAKRRRIFKVETIGDCYVAVSGLPEPRADHAMVMSKFSSDIMNVMRTLTRDLETTLGPDTGDLALRIGLHSGPVTAGVLRGERARFQLFGDTMNTAARMEQTGIKNRVQVSQATADCLLAGGKR
jgi:class 3 adenylate cyclase